MTNDAFSEVEKFLVENPHLKLSVKSIAKKTGFRVRQVTYKCYNSQLIRKVDPIEVGSLKTKMNTFTAI